MLRHCLQKLTVKFDQSHSEGAGPAESWPLIQSLNIDNDIDRQSWALFLTNLDLRNMV